MKTTYDLILTGSIVENIGLDKTKKNIAKLFKMDNSTVSAFFTASTPTVVKQELDEKTAKSFMLAIQRAGALCFLQPTQKPKPRKIKGRKKEVEKVEKVEKKAKTKKKVSKQDNSLISKNEDNIL